VKTTVQEYIGGWLAQRELTGLLTAVSARQYEVTFRRHVIPVIGPVPIGKVGVPTVRLLMDTLIDRSTLSMRTVRLVRARLKTVLDSAVKQGMLESNPLDIVDVGRPRASAVRTLTQGQLRQILAHVRHHTLGVVFRLAVSTGLNRRELVDLRWASVDLKNKRLRLLRGRMGQVRWVPLTEDMAAELSRLRGQVGRLPGLSEYDIAMRPVLMTQQGNPWSLSGLSNRVRGVFKDAELDGFHLQDLRHTYAIALLRSNRSLKEVGELLGMSGLRSARNSYGMVDCGAEE
jgi:integrase